MSAPISAPNIIPNWFVTDGDKVVGPVDTRLLLKGVSYGRVPSGCFVSQGGWSAWRDMETIREVQALRRYEVDRGAAGAGAEPWELAASTPPLCSSETRSVLAGATDPGELMLLAMNEAIRETRASCGLVHRMRAPYVGLVTSCARGPNALPMLGHVISERDPALTVAELGTHIAGKPWSSPARSAIAERLDGSAKRIRGVAMVPIRCAGRLYAMMELGRTDHRFRTSDRRKISAIATAAARRLEIVTQRC